MRLLLPRKNWIRRLAGRRAVAEKLAGGARLRPQVDASIPASTPAVAPNPTPYSYTLIEAGQANPREIAFPAATPKIGVHAPATVTFHFALQTDGRIDARLLHHNAHEFEARYQAQLSRARLSPRWNLPVPDDEEWCLVGGHLNFYHFVANYLPRLCYYRTVATEGAKKRQRYVVANDLPARYYEYLGRLGVGCRDLMLVPRHVQLEISRLTVASLPVYFGPGALAADVAALDWLRQEYRVDQGGTDGRVKVFLTRKHARHRRIVNEDALFDLAAERGFIRLCPEDVSLDVLLSTLQMADVLVTPFGAGAINSLFCPRDATIIELLGPSALHKFNGVHLYAAVGQRSTRVVCEELNENMDWQFRDLRVSEGDFKLALDMLDAKSD